MQEAGRTPTKNRKGSSGRKFSSGVDAWNIYFPWRLPKP
jgi:hypothetical protein